MPITSERLRELVSYDSTTGIFTWRVDRRGNARAKCVAGHLSKKTGYISISVDDHSYLAHRLAYLYVNGALPNGCIDHINRVKSDNRIENLRVADASHNRANSKVNSSSRSGWKGVFRSRHGNRWRARISVNSKTVHLGTFATKDDAHAAYLTAAKNHYGDFANGGSAL